MLLSNLYFPPISLSSVQSKGPDLKFQAAAKKNEQSYGKIFIDSGCDELLSKMETYNGDSGSSVGSYSRTPSLTSVLNAKKKGLSIKNNFSSVSPEYELNGDYNHSGMMNSTSLTSEDEEDLFDDLVEDIDTVSSSSPMTSYSSISYPVALDDHPLALEEDMDLFDEEFCYCNNHGVRTGGVDTLATKKPASKSKSVSGLTKLFKKFTSFTQQLSSQTTRHNKNMLILLNSQVADDFSTPRITDDKFLASLPMTEMKTFDFGAENGSQEADFVSNTIGEAAATHENAEAVPILKRQRENRTNSKFLRIYAHDLCSKLKGNLSYNDDELDYYMMNPQLLPNGGEDLRISLLLRDKLWSNVVLPPREDEIPNYCVTMSSGISGARGVVKSKDNKVKYQFTKKGYVSERWL